MDEKDYQTIIAILRQQAVRRLWFTIHLIIFAANYLILGGRIERLLSLQDQGQLINTWAVLLICHFIYICWKETEGRILRRRLGHHQLKDQVMQHRQKRKNSPHLYHDELIDDEEIQEKYKHRNNYS